MITRRIALFLIAAGTACGADPKLLGLAMPDTKVLAGLNATTAKTTPLGQFVMGQMQGSIPQLPGMIAATGFNPLTDLTEVLVAGTASPASPGPLLMMDGTFKVDQIVAALKSQTVQSADGNTVITFPAADGKPATALAFIGTGIAVAGNASMVQDALGRVAAPSSIDPGLAARVATLSGSSDAWLASIAPLSALLAGTPMALGTPGGAPSAGAQPGGQMMAQATQMLSSIQAISGAVQMGANVQLALQAVANSPKNAQALGDVMRLLMSLGAMNAAGDPQTAGLMQALQQMQVSTSGTQLDLALTLPEAQVEALLKSMLTAAPAGAAPKSRKGN